MTILTKTLNLTMILARNNEEAPLVTIRTELQLKKIAQLFSIWFTEDANDNNILNTYRRWLLTTRRLVLLESWVPVIRTTMSNLNRSAVRWSRAICWTNQVPVSNKLRASFWDVSIWARTAKISIVRDSNTQTTLKTNGTKRKQLNSFIKKSSQPFYLKLVVVDLNINQEVTTCGKVENF